jgi:hypothetical protein
LRSLALAEWLLARFTSEGRAASIAGDLFEEYWVRGHARFWLSVCGVLLSFVWRGSLAFAVALCLGLYSFDFLHNLVYNVHEIHQPAHALKPLLDFVCLASILFSFGMAYSAIRFGVRDAFTQQIVVAWGLGCILSAYWWISPVAIACTLLGAWNVLSSALNATRRRALIASVLALGFGIAIHAITSYLVKNLAESHVPIFNRLAFYVFTLSLVLQPLIYPRIHAIFSLDKLRTDGDSRLLLK